MAALNQTDAGPATGGNATAPASNGKEAKHPAVGLKHPLPFVCKLCNMAMNCETALIAHNKLGVDCSADSFVTADDDLVTCGLRTVEDIVEEVSSQPRISTSDEEDDECQNGDDQPPSGAETMHALDILRHVVTSETVRENTTAQFFSFENSLLADLTEKKTQKDIRDFFPRK
ncbi:hypothetical protein V5799_011030 [Amblyomma americanum]|uniref:Uncharacterized protein n=1 Tax=Amblyomma americanum TaxID=6943 RepID=A0AAQ4EI33_AMBAM